MMACPLAWLIWGALGSAVGLHLIDWRPNYLQTLNMTSAVLVSITVLVGCIRVATTNTSPWRS